jgi:uncharacterized membrane protein
MTVLLELLKRPFLPQPQDSPDLGRILIGVILALGLWFRLANLDHKVYWGDEAYTSLRVSGYTTTELVHTVAQGKVITVADLYKFQHPTAAKGLSDTIRGLVQEEPQLTPLYFVSLRLWAQAVGSSIGMTRLWSVLFGLLCLPAIYWLCQELFASPTVGWLATGLVAISPLHVLYAQEARMYSLWILLTVISSAAFLRALRYPSGWNWLWYGVALTLSLYTYLLTLVTLVGYGVYGIVLSGWRWNRAMTAYLMTSIISLGLFSPWIVILIKQRVLNSDSFAEGGEEIAPTSGLSLLKHWSGIISRTFIDLNVTTQSPTAELVGLAIVSMFLIGLVGYALYGLQRQTPKRVWGFVYMLCLAFPIALLPRSLSDTLPPRYIIPTLLGFELAVAYGLATQLQRATSARQRLFWRSVTGLVMAIGVISCSLNVHAESWWNKQFSQCNPQIARTVNASPQPLVISDGTGGIFDHGLSNVLALSHLLRSTVHLQLVIEPVQPQIPSQFSDIFVFTPSDSLRTHLAKTASYKLEPVLEGAKPYRGSKVCLWKLQPIS